MTSCYCVVRSRAVSLDNTIFNFKKGCSLFYNQRPSIPSTTALQKAALDKLQTRHMRSRFQSYNLLFQSTYGLFLGKQRK